MPVIRSFCLAAGTPTSVQPDRRALDGDVAATAVDRHAALGLDRELAVGLDHDVAAGGQLARGGAALHEQQLMARHGLEPAAPHRSALYHAAAQVGLVDAVVE